MRRSLRGRGRFVSVRRSRLRASAGWLEIRAVENGLREVREGYAVRGVQTAVERNRLRRRLRAAMGDRIDDLGGLDVVISAGPAGLLTAPADLRLEVDRCLDELLAGRQARPPAGSTA